MRIEKTLTAAALLAGAERVFGLAADKSLRLDRRWDPGQGAPVFTVAGQYTTRGWTEWTQGFQYGCLILAGDGLDDPRLVTRGRTRTMDHMLPHVTHTGVHDHGFNNLSTYGNLLRLMDEGRLGEDGWERRCYQHALAVSGAVQAGRWSRTHCGLGYVYSFNGPHSLFIDTMRTLRVLGVAHQLGHTLMAENDERHDLLGRLLQHALATVKYLVFDGSSSHGYDVRGRTAHEATFNRNDGRFRARATQQGYSPFSTWTRGLAWAMLGFAEQLEFLVTLPPAAWKASGIGMTKKSVLGMLRGAAIDTCEHYIREVSALDGIPYWDDGAPGLAQLGGWRDVPAQVDNDHEPVDASAAAIAAQGLIRLGVFLGGRRGARFEQAGFTVARTLFDEPYLAVAGAHQGLLLHSIYHWPNRWDHVPPGARVARGESSMWGDYHLLELALLIQRLAQNGAYPTYFLKRGSDG